MYKLSDSVTRKFTDVIDLDDWEIDTPTGWKSAVRIMKTIPYQVWRVDFEDGNHLECADTHILIDKQGNEVFVRDLVSGSKVLSKNGISVVSKISSSDISESMYDIEVDSEDHLFFTNDVVSHNTTTTGAYLLHRALFNKNDRIGILANKEATANEILDRIKKMFEALPWWLKPGIKEWNKTMIELGNGSKLQSAATSSSSIRGLSLNCILLDEFAHIQNAIEFYTSTYPVISSGKTTQVIIASTPNGMNLFYKLWTESKQGKNDYVTCEFDWSAHPDRDEKWKEQTMKNISQRQFDQEFGTEFFGSSDTLISPQKLQSMTYEDPIRVEEYINYYEMKLEDMSYVIVVDISEGIGKDYSVATVFNVSKIPYKQVAVFRSNIIPPIILADVTHRLAMYYNEAFIIVESNSIGKIVADTLYYDYEYENILRSQTKDSDSTISFKNSTTVGIKTTKKTKAIGCSNLKVMIESDTLVISDYNTLEELSSFVMKGTSFQAEDGKNDDIVMTLVIFAWFSSQPFFEDINSLNFRTTIKENLSIQADNSHTCFGFLCDGIDDIETMTF